MAKKKSRAVVKKGPPPKVASVFDCPKCSYSNCVEVKIRRTQMLGILTCRVCNAKYEERIHPLMREVNVFCNWKDKIEEEAELKRQGRWLGFQKDDEVPEEETDLRVSAKSKAIVKPKKKLHREDSDQSPEPSDDDEADINVFNTKTAKPRNI